MRPKEERDNLGDDSMVVSQVLPCSHCHEVIDIGIYLPKDSGGHQKNQEPRNYAENEG
jgi:hypothetical protein